MPDSRGRRLNEEIKRALSHILKFEMKDPRISDMCVVTGVEVTRDLKYAKVYISVLGDQVIKENTMKSLRNAKGFLRTAIAKSVDIRRVPELIFEMDESISYGLHISKLLSGLNIENDENTTYESDDE